MDNATLTDAGLGASAPGRPDRPVSVGVAIDLEWTPSAGGHVKAWERFAEAAAELGPEVDLTLYFLGEREAVHRVADHVRYVLVPPALGTGRLPFVQTGTGQTDIAPRNRRAERAMARHDVLHATHAFALSRSAARLAARTGKPLVASMHTDFAAFAPVYARATAERVFGPSALTRCLLARLDAGRRMQRAEAAVLRRARHVLAANPTDRERAAALVGAERTGILRRGVDNLLFHPGRRDRDWLAARWGVPPDGVVLAFVGRVDATKGVATMAGAARILAARGAPVHALVIGAGAQAGEVAAMLGERATLTGAVDQDTVARMLASSDVFVFPSRSEVIGNAVLEAKAAGLPPVLADHGATAQNLAAPGTDGVLVAGDDPADWADAVGALVDDPARRAAMARAARADVEARVPAWRDVVREDLLPVWRAAADEAGTAPGVRLGAAS